MPKNRVAAHAPLGAMCGVFLPQADATMNRHLADLHLAVQSKTIRIDIKRKTSPYRRFCEMSVGDEPLVFQAQNAPRSRSCAGYARWSYSVGRYGFFPRAG